MRHHKVLLWGAFTLALIVTSATTAAAAGAKPARPTALHAKATSTVEAALTWADNAVNESEYHLEIRTSATGAWSDMGPIPPNSTFIRVFQLKPQSTYYFRMRARNINGWSPYSNESAVTTYYANPPACVAGDTVMCLDGGRYRVEATYSRGADGLHGSGHTNTLSEESGLFWFFDASNVEAIIKVLDGCSVNNHRWVYTTGLTDLRVLLTITDTQTGATATYLNEGGGVFTPVNDTEALPCN